MTTPKNNNEEKCKICPECKNTLHESAFSWYGEVCNGCGEFLKNKPRDSDLEKPQPPTEPGWEKQWNDKFFRFIEVGAVEHSDEMIPFIKSLLASERAKLVEGVEGMKQIECSCAKILSLRHACMPEHDDHSSHRANNGFNQALEDVVDLIKGK